MNRITSSYIKNDIELSKSFCFETFGQQLLYLSECADKFDFKIPDHLQKRASILYRHLLDTGVYNKNLEASLVVSLAKNLFYEVSESSDL